MCCCSCCCCLLGDTRPRPPLHVGTCHPAILIQMHLPVHLGCRHLRPPWLKQAVSRGRSPTAGQSLTWPASTTRQRLAALHESSVLRTQFRTYSRLAAYKRPPDTGICTEGQAKVDSYCWPRYWGSSGLPCISSQPHLTPLVCCMITHLHVLHRTRCALLTCRARCHLAGPLCSERTLWRDRL